MVKVFILSFDPETDYESQQVVTSLTPETPPWFDASAVTSSTCSSTPLPISGTCSYEGWRFLHAGGYWQIVVIVGTSPRMMRLQISGNNWYSWILDMKTTNSNRVGHSLDFFGSILVSKSPMNQPDCELMYSFLHIKSSISKKKHPWISMMSRSTTTCVDPQSNKFPWRPLLDTENISFLPEDLYCSCVLYQSIGFCAIGWWKKYWAVPKMEEFLKSNSGPSNNPSPASFLPGLWFKYVQIRFPIPIGWDGVWHQKDNQFRHLWNFSKLIKFQLQLHHTGLILLSQACVVACGCGNGSKIFKNAGTNEQKPKISSISGLIWLNHPSLGSLLVWFKVCRSFLQ